MQKFTFKKTDDFDIGQILTCGQIFRFEEKEDGAFAVWSKNEYAEIVQNDNEVTVNCTIADNRFLNTVSFDMGYTGGVEFRNCIFARNRDASGYWRNMTFYEAHAGYISIVGNVIGPGRHVPGNSTGTIAITDAEENGLLIGGDDEHPYASSRKSKALNAGMAEEWMRSATDIRNDSRYARLRDGEIDAGCYQYWRFSSGMSIVFR